MGQVWHFEAEGFGALGLVGIDSAELTPPGPRPGGDEDGTGEHARLPSWDDECVLRYGDLALDPRTRQVRRGARAVELSRLEFNLLELFLHHPHMVLTRGVIYDRVWGYGVGTTSKTLNVHIMSLRGKLESGGEPRLIRTVHGVGYVLRD
jgi:two-component system, OmpR family, response regulator MprA